ncbi:hypothetical protein ACMT1E_12435 [Sphingomonas flavalba]|uniref:PAS domain-containing protein n=1 Tax=Sphingomonas flavalba TaxID=2559804 RepID=UPI0039E0C825
MRGFDRDAGDTATIDDAAVEAPPAIGTDERRMHVRAYNYWVSLLGGRAYPAIEDLDPSQIADFGPNSVLLDFTGGIENPKVAWLGAVLREECGLGQQIASIADVPSRSLLSRLTDHYLQIIANRAPIGFEAEFVNSRGRNTMYRGILMPFSSDEDSIDFIYGVINWKEVVAEKASEALAAEIGQALRHVPRAPLGSDIPVWADGPHASPLLGEPIAYDAEAAEPSELDDSSSIYDWLAAARESAESAQHSERRSRGALYTALGLAFDFSLIADARPEEYGELLKDSGIAAQARAPMTPIVKLVFGINHDKTRLTEYAAALSHGRRLGIASGGLPALLDNHAGGLKGIVQAERRLRAPAGKPNRDEEARTTLRSITPCATVALDTGEAEFVVLVARRVSDGTLGIVAPIASDVALIDRAIRIAAAEA